jgi:hypothetical protein
VLSYNDSSDHDNIVIKPCSFAELRYLLGIAFGDLHSREVTAEMLESFCCNYLKPITKGTKK